MMTRAQPLQIIVGLDFGTAFTKVMVRNAVTDELFAVPFTHQGQTDFFLPSVLYVNGDTVAHPLVFQSCGGARTIPYLKMALAEKCRNAPDRWLHLVNRANDGTLPFAVSEYIESLTGYFLLEVVREAWRFACNKWPDFGTQQGDRAYFQMSVPAEDAQQERVIGKFRQCLCWAVENLYSSPYQEAFPGMQKAIENQRDREDCFFLAEVTANVMAYRRSREGRPGLFLSVDVGAGTVDLSIFLYPRPEHFGDQQNYTAATVSLTGSSHIEMTAWNAAQSEILDALRLRKEEQTRKAMYNLNLDARLDDARQLVAEVLEMAIRATLGNAKDRHAPIEFESMKVLVGGGGWCDVPYRQAMEDALRGFRIEPDIYPLPQPENAFDVWGEDATRLAPRFSVAHGLSYPFWEWPEERYPHQMDVIEPEPRRPRAINPAHQDDG